MGTFHDIYRSMENETPQECYVVDCHKKPWAKGLCGTHYSRKWRHGDPNITLQAPAGAGFITKTGYHDICIKGKHCKVHRLVMEVHLGRKLLPCENVHHINGNRSDNRLENLEIWNTKQPCGQRPEDKVAYAIEILNLYAPEKLK